MKLVVTMSLRSNTSEVSVDLYMNRKIVSVEVDLR